MEVLLAQAVRADAAVAREDSEFAVLGTAGRRRRSAARAAGPRRRVLRDLPAAARRTPGAQRRGRAGRGRGVLRCRRATGSSTSTRSGRASPPSPAPAGWSGCAAPRRCSSTPRTTRPAPRRWRRRWPRSSTSGILVGVVSVMADKDVDGILAALEPAFDQIVVTHNGSPRALDVEALALRAEERFGQERVITAATLPDAIEMATALVEEAGNEGESYRRQRDRDHRLGRHCRGGAHAVRKGSRVTDDPAGTAGRRSVEELPRRHGRHADPGGHRRAAGAAGGRARRRRSDRASRRLSDRLRGRAGAAGGCAGQAVGDLGEPGDAAAC